MGLAMIKKESARAFMVLFIALLCLTFLKLATYHVQLIKHPYPLEYREGMFLVSTDTLLKGQNPFALANQPNVTNVYGLVYHYLVLPFANLWGSTFLVHRLVTAACMLGCLGILYWFLRKEQVSRSLALSGVVIFYAALLAPNTTTAISGGSALGLLLMMASIAIPYSDGYRWRSLFLSVLLTTLAFYTKMYFVVGGLLVASYLFLFIDRKRGLLFGLGLLAAVATTLFIVNRLFETYVSVAIFININAANYNLVYLLQQLKTLANFHRDLLIAAVVGSVASLPVILGRTKPLISLDLFLLLGGVALICVKLGGNQGSWMGYLFHLITPWLIVFTLKVIGRTKWSTYLGMILIGVSFISYRHDFNWSTDKAKDWETAKLLIEKHDNILNSPLLVSFLLENGKTVYDCGATKWSLDGVDRRGIWGSFLSPDRALYVRNVDFTHDLIEGIKAKRFDLIALTPEFTQFNFSEIQEGYRAIGTLSLYLPHSGYGLPVVVLLPQPKKPS